MKCKFWWKGEPLILGSLRYRVIDNDLINNMRNVLNELKHSTTIDEAVKIAHKKGLSIRFKLEPK